MNELLFLLADTNMREAVAGLLTREAIFQTMNCAPFDFDWRQDIIVAEGLNDSGLYARANELLQPLAGQYRHAIVIIDEEWEGSPGADLIRKKLDHHLARAGWTSETSLSLVAQPEADIWLWADSTHVASVLGWTSWRGGLQPALKTEGWLQNGETKPKRPKEAAEWALRHGQTRLPRSASLYRKMTSRVSIKRCQDASLKQMIAALQKWFPL